MAALGAMSSCPLVHCGSCLPAPSLQLALRETPRHKVRRVSKLRERINELQKEVAQLQVRLAGLGCATALLSLGCLAEGALLPASSITQVSCACSPPCKCLQLPNLLA